MSEVDTRTTATAELVLEPQVRQFAERRWLLAALAIPLLALAAYVAVLRLSSLEQMLVADAAHVSRAVLYELPRGNALAAPIEPGTQIIRLAMHAYARESELPAGKRVARLHVVAEGAGGRRIEDVAVDVPGQQTRVTSDEPGLAIGDPVGVDFDVHDLGAGELTVDLTDIDRADGLLVRMYRREAVSSGQTTTRDRVLDLPRKNHLARWTWELAWDEASSAEQEDILSDRWRRVGALRGAGHDLRSVAVALVPRPTESRTPPEDDSLGGTTLRGDERLAFIAHGAVSLRVTSDLAATLTAVVRDLHGGVRTEHGSGELALSTREDDESVEIGADKDVLINVRTPEPRRVDWFGFTQAWRVSGSTAVVVESPEVDRLVRVTLRRPVARGEPVAAPIDALVEVTAPRSGAIRRKMHADRPRSRFDRYGGFDPTQTPTDRVVFFVTVPRGGAATIASATEEPLDVSLAELDDSATPEALALRAFDEPPPRMTVEGVATWAGFVPRRPSNADAFDAAHTPVVRIARHFVDAEPRPTVPPKLLHFATTGGPTREQDGFSFDTVGQTFRAEADGQRPALVPFRVLGAPGTQLLLRVSSGPKTLRAGVFDRVTLPRSVTLGAAPTRGTLVIGDDIPRGPVTLDVVARAAARPQNADESAVASVWIHLPRAARRAATHLPRWIAGQFEE